ncbi:MAG: hypothetical protein HN742_01925 [Lentisphaerae bacterium]|jgi:hypothetical protein|nr:hypothetical protein [Lentisphaerota bacterium]MBT4816152.1 hypothetical protein [Lentisphaerota bacterium]MBT5612366.1 hypothetical protein [Lentisphaerota bacterium]MBT7056670.1 hypothetical protein [Lentisphaerota bacterium]MBT7840595.1 hypothetical protein [Lentisphaerota bacterium]
MMRQWSRVLGSVTLAASVLITSPICFGQQGAGEDQSAAPVDICGLYKCESADPSGTCLVTRTGDTYQLRWKSGDDDPALLRQGTGIRQGTVLAVSWNAGNQSGVTAYLITAGPTLVGKSSVLFGSDALQTETLLFQKPLAEIPPPREWKIGETALVNWSGDEYWYTATIAKRDGLRYFICFDDEGWFWVDPSRITEDDIEIGDRVFAKLTKAPNYKVATVTERDGRMIRVKFDDHSEVTTTINFIKVLRPGGRE